MLTTIRLHQLLFAAALLVPAALFGGAAWLNYHDVLREGRETVGRTVAIMHEHARKVFETEELLLALVTERVDGMSWDQIAEPGTSQFLRKLKAPLEQAVSVWVADATGRIRAGSQPAPDDEGIVSRDFFKVHQNADVGTYVSEGFVGRATGMASFAISRRITRADGSFRGTVHVAASPEYFARFYAEAAPPYAHFAALLRQDGAFLARDPPLPGAPLRLPPKGLLMDKIAAQPAGGAFDAALRLDGVHRFYEYRQVGNYPVYVLFGVERSVLLGQWHDNMEIYGLFAAAASLTLSLVSWFALHRARAEQAALALLRHENAQRLAAEQQLRHAQRMDAVGQLTGGVAHDFNNLLTAILGNLELILRTTGENRPDDERRTAHAKITRLAGTAIKAVQRGSMLTKSLLAFSRTQPLQTQTLDVNVLLDEFSDLMRQAVGVKITVEIVPAPNLPQCRVDAAQLEAAILNMAINARDVMPDGGRIRIATGTAAVSAHDLQGNTEAQPGSFVTIMVEDTGDGMPPDVAAKAFEPFFTTKPIGSGTGLGLSQVFGFVRQLGGHVTLRSTVGHGTTITLFLPEAVAPRPVQDLG